MSKNVQQVRNQQTFAVDAVGDPRAVDTLDNVLIGGFLGDRRAFELTLRSVSGFEFLGVFGSLVVGQGLALRGEQRGGAIKHWGKQLHK